MKKFRVTVHYKGAIDLIVEAENEDQAQLTAIAEFEDASEMEILANIDDVSTNGYCTTEVEEDEDDS